ncbi:MAG: gamma-glutamyl-gamma-aminobutyrate hydrolase family protein [Aeromonas sp.]
MPTFPSNYHKPRVLMTMGHQARGGHPYQVMTHKYMRPVQEISDCLPLLVPTHGALSDISHYLALADGVYLSGAGTNIDPVHYGQANHTPEKLLDPARDAFDIALIHAALELGLPILGVCRGMQEINVALGGSLHQQVYKTAGYFDHREDPNAPLDEQYGLRHPVQWVAGSWLQQALGQPRVMVNSLHGQGIAQLGQGLEPLAVADDGLIEAFHAPNLSPFLLGVQWHPEWKAQENPTSVHIFTAFGQACRTFAQRAERAAIT